MSPRIPIGPAGHRIGLGAAGFRLHVQAVYFDRRRAEETKGLGLLRRGDIDFLDVLRPSLLLENLPQPVTRRDMIGTAIKIKQFNLHERFNSFAFSELAIISSRGHWSCRADVFRSSRLHFCRASFRRPSIWASSFIFC